MHPWCASLPSIFNPWRLPLLLLTNSHSGSLVVHPDSTTLTYKRSSLDKRGRVCSSYISSSAVIDLQIDYLNQLIVLAKTEQMWWIKDLTNLTLFSPGARHFVIKSAGLSWVLMQVSLHSSRAVPSRTKLCAMLLDFFFRLDSGLLELTRTDLLSAQMQVGRSKGIPIILNL